VPIVFAGVIDPVGAGLVESLARPGGNTTGFSGFEYGMRPRIRHCGRPELVVKAGGGLSAPCAKFKQEYPGTANEAFETSGEPAPRRLIRQSTPTAAPKCGI
jgi:hypothetical protein